MPHLSFGGRYWRVASDEFWLTGSCTILFRFAWILFLSIVLINSGHLLSKCSDGWSIFLYLCGSFFICALTFVCEVVIVGYSITGTIVESKIRDERVSFFIAVHAVLAIFQIAAAVVGSIIVWNHSKIPCSSQFDSSVLDVTLISLLVITQFIDFAGLMCCCRLVSSASIDSHLATRDDNWEIEVWEKRAKSLCSTVRCCSCNIIGGGNIGEDLEAFAKMLILFFHHDGFLDVVPSDVLAGCILVRMEQMGRIDDCLKLTSSPMNENVKDVEQGKDNLYPVVKPITIDDLTSVDLLKELSYYSVFALAIYSHIFALIIQPVTGSCGMCYTRATRVPITCGCLGENTRVAGDDCLSMNETGTIHIIKNRNHSELVFASFSNNTSAKPYAIFSDKVQNAIVVSIRGTLSLEDAVTDVLCSSTEMTAAGQQWGFAGEGKFAHGGMLKSAMFIREEIHNKKILKKLLSGEEYNGVSLESDSRKVPINNQFVPPKLVVVGHSLGAGVAVLLSLLLKAEYPALTCMTYGTPASVIDAKTAKECESFVTSCCLGDDIVCRLSVPSVMKFRDQVLDCLSRAKVSKMVIMQSIFKPYDAQKVMYSSEEAPDSEFRVAIKEFQKCLHDRIGALNEVPLVIPGKVVHLQRDVDRTSKGCCGGCLSHSNFTPVETHMHHFSEIVVSPTMLHDHFPDLYMNHLKETVAALNLKD